MPLSQKPSHIRALESLGVSYDDLCTFRRQLQGFRITVAWNDSLRVWILGKVPRTGPTFLSLKAGHGALIELMADPMAVARDFERMEHSSAQVA